MFFHTNSIKEFKIFVQNLSFVIIVATIIVVKERWDSKAEKQLMIVNGEGNNFTMKYEQLLEGYNGRQCDMVFINNVTTT
jgi:hypothetical protein